MEKVQRIQKVQLKPQVGPEGVDESQLSSSWMQERKVQRAFSCRLRSAGST